MVYNVEMSLLLPHNTYQAMACMDCVYFRKESFKVAIKLFECDLVLQYEMFVLYHLIVSMHRLNINIQFCASIYTSGGASEWELRCSQRTKDKKRNGNEMEK